MYKKADFFWPITTKMSNTRIMKKVEKEGLNINKKEHDFKKSQNLESNAVKGQAIPPLPLPASPS
jgi:hypothetical protein